MEFTECELSGHQKADGNKGQYWIINETGAWVYVELVEPTPAGPKVKTFSVSFRDSEEAKLFIESHDEFSEVA